MFLLTSRSDRREFQLVLEHVGDPVFVDDGEVAEVNPPSLAGNFAFVWVQMLIWQQAEIKLRSDMQRRADVVEKHNF